MKLFKLDNEYNVMPEKDTVMMVPEFAILWTLRYNKTEKDHDGRKRFRARAELQYLYFFCDYQSEFAELSDPERKESALDSAGLSDDYKLSPELIEAEQKYFFMQETRELKLLKSAYGTIDKLREYFDDVVIDDKNAKSLIDNLSKLGATLEGLEKLESRVKKKESKAQGHRGNADKGFLDS
jgi:hypothetical protein